MKKLFLMVFAVGMASLGMAQKNAPGQRETGPAEVSHADNSAANAAAARVAEKHKNGMGERSPSIQRETIADDAQVKAILTDPSLTNEQKKSKINALENKAKAAPAPRAKTALKPLKAKTKVVNRKVVRSK